MAQVSLQINGYGYVLGCADGEETHLFSLATDLDRRIEEVKTATGITGEGRLLVMAALMLADELHDLKKQTDAGGSSPSAAAPARANRRLRGLAKRAEDLAAMAEAPAITPDPAPAATSEVPDPDPDAPAKEQVAANGDHP
jgi:cell division protein ZapA